MEKVILVGKLQKAELKASTNTGKQYYNLAVVKTITKQDGTTAHITRYVNIFSEYLMQKTSTIAQGSTVLIEGSISESAYLNKEGKAVASVSIIASNIESLDGTTQPVMQQPIQAVQQPVMQQPVMQQPVMQPSGAVYPAYAQATGTISPVAQQAPTLQQTFQTNPYQNNNNNF